MLEGRLVGLRSEMTNLEVLLAFAALPFSCFKYDKKDCQKNISDRENRVAVIMRGCVLSL